MLFLSTLDNTSPTIQPIQLQPDDYDKIIIMSPVWAGHPVSAIYTVIDLLPTGKQVELIMTSRGGSTQRSVLGTKALVTDRGCEIVGYSDVVVKIDKLTGEVSATPVKPMNLSYLVTIGVAIGTVLLAAVGIYKLAKKIKGSL